MLLRWLPLLAAVLLVAAVVMWSFGNQQRSDLPDAVEQIVLFLSNSTDGDVHVTLLNAETVRQKKAEIEAICDSPVELVPHYQITARDDLVELTLYVNYQTQETVCLVKERREAISPPAPPGAPDSSHADETLETQAEETGLDLPAFTACLESGRYKAEVEQDYHAGVAAGVVGVPTLFINGRSVLGAQPYATYAAIILAELEDPTTPAVSIDEDPLLGKASAPVTLVMFCDYQSSHCARFFSQVEPLLRHDFVDTGKARFVYRDFPIEEIYPDGPRIAQATECADEQGKFWEFHDHLYQDHAEWGSRDPNEALR